MAKLRQILLEIVLVLHIAVAFNIFYQDPLSIEVPNDTPPLPAPDSKLLSEHHFLKQLIEVERSSGLVAEYDEAEKNISAFLQLASDINAPEKLTKESVKTYYQEIANLIDRHFIYKAKTGLAEGFANRTIDCDLRSYLYKTISETVGIDTRIVSAPGHALIGWQNPNDESDTLYWETTGVAGPTDMKSKFYKASSDKYDYTLLDSKITQDYFSAFAFYKAYKKNINTESNQSSLKALFENYPDSSLYKKMWISVAYPEDSPPMDELVTLANEIIQVQPQDATARYTLMDYHDSKLEHSEVLHHFAHVEKNDLDIEELERFSKASKSTFWQASVWGYKWFFQISLSWDRKAEWKNYANISPAILALMIAWAYLRFFAPWIFKKLGMLTSSKSSKIVSST